MSEDKRLYTRLHAWVRTGAENGGKEIGLSGYAIEKLEGVVYLAFEVKEGDEIKIGDIIASVESTKTTDALYSPVNGVVRTVARHVETDPKCLEGCDGDMTLAVIELCGQPPEGLMSREDYDKYTEGL